MLGRLASNAVEPLLLRPVALGNLVAVGQAVAMVGATGATPSNDQDVVSFGGYRPDATRALALAILTRAPWGDFDARALDDLARYAPVNAQALGRYLCQSNHPVSTPAEVETYRRYALMLLDHSRDRLASGPAGSPEYCLAVELVRGVHLMPLLAE